MKNIKMKTRNYEKSNAALMRIRNADAKYKLVRTGCNGWFGVALTAFVT